MADSLQARAPSHSTWVFCVLLKLAILAVAGRQYGYLADELYFLDAAGRLAAGYVDFPPAIAWIIAGVTAVFGSDLIVLRTLACLVGVGVAIVAVDVSRLLGAGKTGQWITAIVVIFAPAFLSIQSILTMNVFDQLWWAAGFWLLIRYLDEQRPGHMLLLGVVIGCALLTKLSIIFWIAAVAASALIYARWCFLRWEVWAAAGIALTLAFPFVYWQFTHDWLFLDFVQAYNGQPAEAMVVGQPLFGLVATMNPLFAVVWLPGLIYGLIARDNTARTVGTAAVICLAMFLAAGVKFYFAAPLFILFTALGANLWERWTGPRPVVRTLSIAALLVSGILAVPVAAPVLPPHLLQRAADFIRDGEQGHQGEDPAPVGRYFPHFAEMHGWPELVEEVVKHYQRIPADERAGVEIVAAYFGQTGALNQLDREDRLPQAYSGHVNYHLWSRGADLDDVLFVGFQPGEIDKLYGEVEVMGQFACQRCMARDNGIHILRARSMKVDADQVRQKIRRFYFF
jgi:hypothetical protein